MAARIMQRRKRSYTPKVKGCYQCSRRRIDCDRAVPSCKKCLERNIQCSGIGIRYRFVEDVTITKIHRRRPEPCHRVTEYCNYGEGEISADKRSAEYFHNGYLDPMIQSGYLDLEQYDLASLNIQVSKHDIAVQEIPSINEHLCVVSCEHGNRNMVDTITLNSLEPMERYFLLYFSEKIAPKLVTVDDDSNGWRRLVLPVAYTDDLVRSAIISASAFCVTAPVTDQLISPEFAYQKVIHGLQQRQDLVAENLIGKQCLILTLLVLLATVIVNGSSDFRKIFRLLEASLKVLQDEQHLFSGDLGVFLTRQITKFRGYASPFLSRDEAVAILSLTTAKRPSSSRGWDEFVTYCDLYPNLSSSMSKIYEINQKACSIYLARAQAGSHLPALIDLVEDVKNNLENFPADCPGEHTLVWACFIVALESSTPDHRQFFAKTLLRHQRRQGFANVAKALEYLAKVWETQRDSDWVQHLTSLDFFVV